MNTAGSIFLALFFIFCLVLGLGFIAGGCYLGVWTMLVGGIVQIIDAAKATPTDAMSILVGILKVIFFELPIIFGFLMGIATIKAGAVKA